MYADATPEYAVHTILAVLLLFVGVGGYNTLMLERQKRTLGVYFSCGMPWKRAAFVLLTGNALLFLIGGAGGRAVGNVQREFHQAHDGGLKAVQRIDGACARRRTAARQLCVHHMENAEAQPGGAHEKRGRGLTPLDYTIQLNRS